MTRQSKHSAKNVIVPADVRNPGDDYLRDELERDRRTERWIALKAAVAIAIVLVLVVIRQVFFE